MAKKTGITKGTGIYDLYRSPCCRIRNCFAMHQNDASPAICSAADAVGYEIGLPCTKTMLAPGIYTAAHTVGYEIGLPCTKTMPAPAICTAADAVGYEIGLSCGESRRDIVFYAAAKGCPHENLFCSQNCNSWQCLSFEEFEGSTTTS